MQADRTHNAFSCALAGYPAQADSRVAVKRKASVVVDAPALHTALAECLALPTDLGCAIRGPRKACKLLCLDEGACTGWSHCIVVTSLIVLSRWR